MNEEKGKLVSFMCLLVFLSILSHFWCSVARAAVRILEFFLSQRSSPKRALWALRRRNRPGHLSLLIYSPCLIFVPDKGWLSHNMSGGWHSVTATYLAGKTRGREKKLKCKLTIASFSNRSFYFEKKKIFLHLFGYCRFFSSSCLAFSVHYGGQRVNSRTWLVDWF